MDHPHRAAVRNLPWDYHDPDPPQLEELRATFDRNNAQVDEGSENDPAREFVAWDTVAPTSVDYEAFVSDGTLDHHTVGVVTRRPKTRRPDQRRSDGQRRYGRRPGRNRADDNRPDGHAPPTPWGDGDPGPPPF